MICNGCNWTYPDNMLNSLIINGTKVNHVCGICALEAINELHGINRTEFSSPHAESMRLSAINWRKNHPNASPD